MLDLMIKGGPVMWPLLLCSLISLTVVIERAIFWLTVDIHRNAHLADALLNQVQSGDMTATCRIPDETTNRIVRVLAAGIEHQGECRARAMETAAIQELKQMRRFMGVLDTMITISPLLGILGTVLGIIQSFDILGSTGIDTPQAVTAGIAQALITTAAGLTVTILSVLPYNYFSGKIDTAMLSMETYATRLEILQPQVGHTPATVQP